MTLRIIHFIESINEETCKGLMNECMKAVDSGATEIQLRISSGGGLTSAGFWLANVLRSLPIKITAHNIGEVSSIAMPMFLSASVRSAEFNSRFVMHPLTWTVTAATSIPHHTLREWVASLDNDVDRYVRIFEEATQDAGEPFDVRAALAGNAPSVMDPARALRAGVVHKVDLLPLQ